jgi:transposase-like protein
MINKHLRSTKTDEPKASAAAPAVSRAKFTDEFKRVAVARLRECDNATLLALELGIRRNQLYKWAKMLDELEPGKESESTRTAVRE